MQSIVQALGPRYLPFVIKEMRQLMQKGYQIHVLIYTVQSLVSAMEEVLQSGDIDACLTDIIEVFYIQEAGFFLFSSTAIFCQSYSYDAGSSNDKIGKVFYCILRLGM